MNYLLIQNHYIVNIDGYTFLIDTGSERSGWVREPEADINIKGHSIHHSFNFNENDLKDMFKTIGCEIDGFIGIDIISETGLTIYKNGVVEFESIDMDLPHRKEFINGGPIVFVNVGMFVNMAFLDTGAKYPYINEISIRPDTFDENDKSLHGLVPTGQAISDWNPIIKRFITSAGVIELEGKRIVVGTSRMISAVVAYGARADIIVNITTLFDEVFVFDFKKHEVRYK